MTDKDIKICGHGSGKPSTKNLNTYSDTRYSQTFKYDDDVIHKGIIRVRRLKTMTDKGRESFHDTYKTILGRNKYSQTYRDYVYTKRSDGHYYSDCSSSGCATYRKVGYNVTNLNTVGILTSSLFEDVPVKISKGHITNPEVLKVGDAILFAGNITRPKYEFCGHVEYVYEMPNTKEDTKKVSVELTVLCKGCKGNEVWTAQTLLINKGFSCGKWGADKDFGSGTESAVIAYQKKHPECGEANGIIGASTWKSLLGA